MKEYYVIKVSDVSELEDKVEEMMKDKWKPQGGICAFMVGCFTWYLQAMVRC